ncbi:MAG: type III toxin-antitoxin system ToxN/AbiQ family toxin, partial [Erysipelotrichales bacterium]|nr:type III toxin-antitoxin system ToxN/AbiQ family toxin [Erysipelotrichales bacterium]
MRFYRPKNEYIKYLFEIDRRIVNSKNILGIPLRLNELIYFLPIDSPTDSDYDNGILKKSSPTVMRMIDMKSQIYYGKCLFSNMFSIPYKELEAVDMSDFDEDKLALMEKKLEFIKKNNKRISKVAHMIFTQKSRKYKQPYLDATIDFVKIEEASLQWELENYGKHYNRFPDQDFFLTNPFIDGVSDVSYTH